MWLKAYIFVCPSTQSRTNTLTHPIDSHINTHTHIKVWQWIGFLVTPYKQYQSESGTLPLKHALHFLLSDIKKARRGEDRWGIGIRNWRWNRWIILIIERKSKTLHRLVSLSSCLIDCSQWSMLS